MKGVSHTTKEGHDFAIKVMKHMKEVINKWKKETNIDFVLYGTQSEEVSYRFAQIDKEKFGEIEGITDKKYYTNSYHVDIKEDMDLFEKLSFENEFQKISSGGSISYIELTDELKDTEKLESLIKFVYDNIQYIKFENISIYTKDT